MSSENPFQPPPELPSDRPGAAQPYPNESSKIRQVRVIAILMMVQGGLVVLLGCFLFVLALIFPALIAGKLGPPQQPGGSSPEMASWILVITYGGLGLAHLIVGGLNIYAGYRNYRYRSKVLGIVALSSGLLTVIFCYCFPTALALMIYGLIIYLDGGVSQAFQRAESRSRE